MKETITKTFEKTVPFHYHEFFDELFKQIHVVNCKVYNLSPKEQWELEGFIEKNIHSS